MYILFIYNKKISHSIIKVLYMQTFNEKKGAKNKD